MKKFILASASGLALLTVAACSDSTDNTTTQSIDPPAATTPAPADPSMTTPPPAGDAAPQATDPMPAPAETSPVPATPTAP